MDSFENITDFIDSELRLQNETGMLRSLFPLEGSQRGLIETEGKPLVDFSSNDYLGLADHPALIEGAKKAMEKWGAGARASRLMSGDLEIHHRLESAIAALKGKEAGLLFGSGYLANTGIIPALCGRNDVIYSDRLNHASIVDGVLLSRARFCRFRHNDMNHLEDLLKSHKSRYRKALIVVESVYSMDGDQAPVSELLELRGRYGAMLMIDEAHATGVFGAKGEGIISQAGAESVDVILSTFGKALGGYGAFVAVSNRMKQFLLNRAKTFIFSTALPPAVIGANLAAVKLLEEEPERRTRVCELASELRRALKEDLGFINTPSESQIVPMMVGDSQGALSLAESLRDAGFFVKAIRPPTVPEGTARLRLSVTANHSLKDVRQLLEALSSGF
ncbi:MAG: 8-amino-7-oxononanoate synthase [Thermodesulfobacteriota bacterium]|nr:MAG: 8-amino-7-oxononanoate synthase [Thermodesulfobacteriota bacterium]